MQRSATHNLHHPKKKKKQFNMENKLDFKTGQDYEFSRPTGKYIKNFTLKKVFWNRILVRGKI